jgi:hypothetical protein
MSSTGTTDPVHHQVKSYNQQKFSQPDQDDPFTSRRDHQKTQTEKESGKNANIGESSTTQNQLAPDASTQKLVIQTSNASIAETMTTLQLTATNANMTKGTNLRYRRHRLELSLLSQQPLTSQMMMTKMKMAWHSEPAQFL